MSETLEEFIQRHEGCRVTPYIDSVGVQTIGVGHNLHKPFPMNVIELLRDEDIKDAKNDCLHAFPWFADLTEPRQWVLVDMCFNLGLAGLRKFAKFLHAVELGDYDTAADEMLDSLWARQVKSRALELASMMRGPENV